MKKDISIILRYIIGVWGSGHHIKKNAKKHPIRNVGIVQLLLYPTKPLKLVKIMNIFHPSKF